MGMYTELNIGVDLAPCAVIWKYVSCTYGTTIGLPYYPQYVVCPVWQYYSY